MIGFEGEKMIGFIVILALLSVLITGTFSVTAEESDVPGQTEKSRLDELAENPPSEPVYSHPFMLADAERLEKLSQIGDEEPWKSMKEKAIELSSKALDDTQYTDTESNDFCFNLFEYVEHNGAAYILDPKNKEVYKKRILESIDYFSASHPGLSIMNDVARINGDNWMGSVPQGNLFAACVVAMDVMYPDLTPQERTKAESALQEFADVFWEYTEVHLENTWGIRFLWAAYNQDYPTMKRCWDQLYGMYTEFYGDDGVPVTYSEYDFARHASDQRTAKFIAPYILEYMGLIDYYYTDTKFQNAAEFTLGYNMTPGHTWWQFSDSNLDGTMDRDDLLTAYISHNMSMEAAGYGMWLNGGDYGAGSLLKLLYGPDDGKLPEPIPPKSRIFPNGGAFFYEDITKPSSIAGAITCQVSGVGPNSHAHKESNSIGIYAYGRMMMANSGYNGWGRPANNFSWSYIQQRAISANTVLFNYEPGNIHDPSGVNDHASQWMSDYNKGITHGFTNDLFCWAKGETGKSIPNGTHNRSFVMVPSQDYVPGYFVEFDDILAQNAGDVATVVQRPVSEVYEEITPNTEYEWTISKPQMTDAKLSIFMANEPDSIEFVDGVVASTTVADTNIKSMLAKYVAGDDKLIRNATVLFPSADYNPKAQMERITADGANGVKLTLSDSITDYLFTSKSGNCVYYMGSTPDNEMYSYDRLSFSGKSVLVRKNSGINSFMFGEDVTKLKCGEEGVEAKSPISVFLKDRKGQIEAYDDTETTFCIYGISDVLYNGEPLDVLSADNGTVTVVIPKGVGELSLICDLEAAEEQILNGKYSNNFYKKITAFDLTGGRIIHNNSVSSADIFERDGTGYISTSLARSIFGSVTGLDVIMRDGVSFVPIRKCAEQNGWQIEWHPAGIVFAVPKGVNFDPVMDAPNIGFAVRLFDLSNETDEATSKFGGIDMIYINGEEIENFDIMKRTYYVNDSGDKFEVTTSPEAAGIDMPNPQDVVISCKQNGSDITYHVYHLTNAPVTQNKGITVTASSEPQQENPISAAIDGNLSTRWSADGTPWICFDLQEVRNVECMYLAWYLGDQRYSNLSVEISTDGENWEKKFDGRTSGTTAEPESIPTGPFTARYVRVTCGGTVSPTGEIGIWNSITDVEFDYAR